MPNSKGKIFISVFDLDHTLLHKNSSVFFCKYLYKKKLFSFTSILFSAFYYIRHRYFALSLASFHKKVFAKILRGLSIDLLEREVDLFLEENLESLFYPPAIERLEESRALGYQTAILSSSPDFLVSAISRRLKVDDWMASQYKIDKDRCLCQIAVIVQGEEKARWVEDKQKEGKVIVAYSDSYLDRRFLEAADIAVVVNPDRKMQKIARQKGWEEI